MAIILLQMAAFKLEKIMLTQKKRLALGSIGPRLAGKEKTMVS